MATMFLPLLYYVLSDMFYIISMDTNLSVTMNFHTIGYLVFCIKHCVKLMIDQLRMILSSHCSLLLRTFLV